MFGNLIHYLCKWVWNKLKIGETNQILCLIEDILESEEAWFFWIKSEFIYQDLESLFNLNINSALSEMFEMEFNLKITSSLKNILKLLQSENVIFIDSDWT